MPNASRSALSATAAKHAQPKSDQGGGESHERRPRPAPTRNTWRRLAPTTRRSASSRVRCPTVIENVLKIVKAPTNSEISAKTNSAVERNESALLTALESSLATVLPADHLDAGRQDLGDRPLQPDVVGARLGQDVDRVVRRRAC